jgi:hypothetical protein
VVNGSVKDRTTEFLLKFGDKGKVLLKTLLEASEENENTELGDFSYKSVKEKLEEKGYGFDPKMLLRSLEKDYGIIETTYKSTNQHWWKFIDKEQVEEALEHDEIEDPKIKLVFLKFYSLDPKSLEKKLSFLMRKSVLTEMDKKTFRNLVFNEISQLTEIYEEASQYEETQSIVIHAKRLLVMAYSIGKRIYGGKNDSEKVREEEGKREDNYADSIRLSYSEDNS